MSLVLSHVLNGRNLNSQDFQVGTTGNGRKLLYTKQNKAEFHTQSEDDEAGREVLSLA